MKGLELSRTFWEDAVRPAIRETCPVLLPRLAAGLCGGGSDCLGYDDELSHDHGYAAGCMLFLAPEDAETHGFLLSALYDRLPREFLGVKTEHRSRQGNGRYGVKTTEQFLLEQTGLFHTPETWREWMAIPSYALAAACAGEIFYDGSGDMTGIRETLRTGMPEDVRVKKIAGHAVLMAQSGQYNVSRCRRHGEEAAARLACCEFVNHTLAMLFLLNERHMPFYKWAFRAARELPKLSELIPTLEALLREPGRGHDRARERSGDRRAARAGPDGRRLGFSRAPRLRRHAAHPKPGDRRAAYHGGLTWKNTAHRRSC